MLEGIYIVQLEIIMNKNVLLDPFRVLVFFSCQRLIGAGDTLLSCSSSIIQPRHRLDPCLFLSDEFK